MEVFNKVFAENITIVLQYSDHSQLQVCYNKWAHTCEIYRVLPDVKGGLRFMRNSKFQLEFWHLLPVIDVLFQVSEDESKYVICTEREKHLVISKNERFGSWNLGYEKKKKIQDVVALKADLDRIDNDDVEVVEIESIQADSGYDCVEPYKGFAFRKKIRLVWWLKSCKSFKVMFLVSILS